MTEKTHRHRKATFVSFLLDETGSMASIKDDTVGGLNEYVKTLKASEGEILFSLVSFNSSQTKKRYVAEPIANVKRVKKRHYQPHAMTPLIDATVKIINATQDAIERRGDDPNVVIVIQTDGHENVSVEYTSKDLARLVKEKEADAWQFVFLGAGLDAFEAARQAGMDLATGRVMSYERDRSPEVFVGTALNVSEFAAGGRASALDFSPEQRAEAGDEYHARRGKKKRTARRDETTPDSQTSTIDDLTL